MDTSSEFIKMCEKAVEIQAFWKPTSGDWYIHDYRGTTKTSRELEKQIWGDSDKTWRSVEIMCYQPTESKDVIISTTGKESLCVSVADLVRGHSIWLPRQDQLQEMLYEKVGSKGFILVNYFVNQLHRGILDNSQIELTSMEQLWLAFVMKERYGKIFSGDDWIK